MLHLHQNVNAYALWLDTAATFDPQWAGQILATFPPTTADDQIIDIEAPRLSALDRLIVSRTLDLPSAVSSIQQIKKEGFPNRPIGRTVSPEEDKKDDREGMSVDEDPGGSSEAAKGKMELAFIVVDTITVLFKGLLSAVSSEGAPSFPDCTVCPI